MNSSIIGNIQSNKRMNTSETKGNQICKLNAT